MKVLASINLPFFTNMPGLVDARFLTLAVDPREDKRRVWSPYLMGVFESYAGCGRPTPAS